MNNGAVRTAVIAEIKRFAVHDGPRIRTTVFLKGCPLRCVWCHNPESISFVPELAYFGHKCLNCGECAAVCETRAHRHDGGKHHFDRILCKACGKCADICPGEALTLYGKSMDTDSVLKTVLEDQPFYRESGGGMTVSGGEPLAQHEFTAELLRKAKSAGLHTAVDTCGEAGEEALRAVIPYTDLFLFDLKHMDSDTHRILTGRGNERILNNLRLLCGEGKPAEIRMPLIPGMNDSEENLRAAGSFLASVPNITRVTLLPYNGIARSKYAALGKSDGMPETAAPSACCLESAAELLRPFGLRAASGRGK